ncbi:MAG TPA: hypothetical protein PKD95_02690 [Candidatus Paceibacterota bacterium]|nr:hypothetical protein [Candidatus Paceibacterota bacterium]
MNYFRSNEPQQGSETHDGPDRRGDACGSNDVASNRNILERNDGAPMGVSDVEPTLSCQYCPHISDSVHETKQSADENDKSDPGKKLWYWVENQSPYIATQSRPAPRHDVVEIVSKAVNFEVPGIPVNQH